jgi:hypothetical protein
MEALILVATLGGPSDVCAHRHHASLEPPAERVFNPSRKETHWDVASWA